jgi:hypothetical protein
MDWTATALVFAEKLSIHLLFGLFGRVKAAGCFALAGDFGCPRGCSDDTCCF